MNLNKRLDSCIEQMQVILSDHTNELGQEQQKLIAQNIRVLKKLKKQTRLSHDELYRAVSQIAESVFKML